MSSLTVTSWSADAPYGITRKRVELSLEEHALVSWKGGDGLSPETLAKLPPPSHWTAFDLSDAPHDICSECDGRGSYLDAPANVLAGSAYTARCHACGGSGRRSLPPRDMREGVWAARQRAYAPRMFDINVEFNARSLMRLAASRMPSYTRVRT